MDKEDWNIYAMEYNTVIKKNEIMPLIATCMDLEIVILSEVNQIQINIIYCLHVEPEKRVQITKQKSSHKCRK